MTVSCEKCKHGKPDTNDKNFVECKFFEKTFPKDFYCKMGEPKEVRKKTQFDRIRAISLDEMAEEFAKDNYCQFCKLDESQTCGNTPCKKGIKQYLESVVQDE